MELLEEIKTEENNTILNKISIKEIKFLLFPLIAMFMFYQYNMSANNLFMIIGILFLTFPVLFFKSDIAFYILLFAISNERMLRHLNGGQSFIATMIVLLAIKLLLENHLKINKKILIYGLLIAIIMVIKNRVFNLLEIDTDLIRFILNSFIISSIIIIYKDKLYELALKSIYIYSLGVFFSSIVSLYHKVSTNNSLMSIFSGRFASLRNDPNYYAVSVSLAISLLLIYYLISRKGSFKILILLSVLVIFGSLSLSRGFIIANIPNIVLLSIVFNKSRMNKKINFIISMGTMLILVNYGSMLNRIINSFTNRFTLQNIDSGRLVLWSTYLDILTDSPQNLLFGLGQFDAELFISKYGLENLAHNLILGAIVSNGFLITTLMVMILLLIYRNFRKYSNIKKWRFYYNIPLFVIIAGYMFLDAINSNSFFYGFCLSLFAAYIMYTYDCKKMNSAN